jgi:hypothetical protein
MQTQPSCYYNKTDLLSKDSLLIVVFKGVRFEEQICLTDSARTGNTHLCLFLVLLLPVQEHGKASEAVGIGGSCLNSLGSRGQPKSRINEGS